MGFDAGYSDFEIPISSLKDNIIGSCDHSVEPDARKCIAFITNAC